MEHSMKPGSLVMKKESSISSIGGFTLFEVIIVITLLTLISSIAFPLALNAIQRSKEASLKATLMSTRIALDDYYSDHGSYPDTLSLLVDSRYLRRLPYDPIEQTTQWDEQYEEGIVDIHSSSRSISLDGSYYRDW